MSKRGHLESHCNTDTEDQCIRLGKPCGYPLKQQLEVADDTDFLLQKIQQLEHQLENTLSAPAIDSIEGLTPPPGLQASLLHENFNDPSPSADWRLLPAEGLVPFPKAFILDADVFSPLLRNRTYDITGKTPCRVLGAIGLGWKSICEQYFSGAHQWLPLLSKKRLAQRLASAPLEFNPGVSMLLLSMKLLTTSLQSRDTFETPLYLLTKQYLSAIESSGSITLSLLQAVLLTAIYEIGHAMHPAAYFSISRAARLGYLLGLHDRDHATQLFKAADTWTLCEEERRTWWAVMILDR